MKQDQPTVGYRSEQCERCGRPILPGQKWCHCQAKVSPSPQGEQTVKVGGSVPFRRA